MTGAPDAPLIARMTGSRSACLGPRETLEHVSAMLKDALRCDDLEALRRELHEMQRVVESATRDGRRPDVRMMRLRSMRMLKQAVTRDDVLG